jgi:DNA-binding transcriptional ArsR family regulator
MSTPSAASTPIPNIAPLGGIIGDRARAAMLTALMGGRALTATELARAAAVTKSTASAHLTKLAQARLVTMERQGRHRYFRLADPHVAAAIEHLTGLAAHLCAPALETGPSDLALRKARVCYDHLAGDLGVLVYDSLHQQGFLRTSDDHPTLTDPGAAFCTNLGIDVATLARARRPLCLPCLDWSVRRHHLAGALGAALLTRFIALGWARPQRASRVILFSAPGELALRRRFVLSPRARLLPGFRDSLGRRG